MSYDIHCMSTYACFATMLRFIFTWFRDVSQGSVGTTLNIIHTSGEVVDKQRYRKKDLTHYESHLT